MSRYFPHPAYAEDQALARTILITHVETRAVTTGALIGAGLFAYRAIRGFPHTVAVAAAKTAPPLLRLGVPFLRTTGINVLWTAGLTSAGLAARMYGREDIEWRDRAWRLLENRGQLETDDWTYPGMLAGVAAYVAAVASTSTAKSPLLLLTKMGGTRGRVGGFLLGALGSAGAGSLVGTAGYMGWRYGVHRGRFPDVQTREVVERGKGGEGGLEVAG